MESLPALPPWGRVTEDVAICISKSAERYNVPELLMHAVLSKEGGTTGQCSKNTNGTVDCGLAQINSTWADYFKKYGVSMGDIKDEPCINIQAQAYILKKNYLNKNDWYKAVMAYHIGPANWTEKRMSRGMKYANDVVVVWKKLDDYSRKYRVEIERKYIESSFSNPSK